MDHVTFWELVDTTRKASGNDGYLQAKLLTEELAQRPDEEIICFDTIFETYMNRAYNRDLWAAAYIINCGCSDDGFMDFRAWLIGQGLIVFENVLSNPESLVDVVAPNTVTQIEDLMNVAKDAYHEKNGVDFPQTPNDLPYLTGDDWDESALPQKYPKLHARFGDCQEWIKFLKGASEESAK